MIKNCDELREALKQHTSAGKLSPLYQGCQASEGFIHMLQLSHAIWLPPIMRVIDIMLGRRFKMSYWKLISNGKGEGMIEIFEKPNTEPVFQQHIPLCLFPEGWFEWIMAEGTVVLTSEAQRGDTK